MRRHTWLLPAAAALAAAWIAAPAAVPLYDGIGFPDEPYRYVDPPDGYQKTRPPTRAVGAGPGTRDLDVKSAEQGPQVEIYIAKGDLTGPATTRGYQIAADPVAPDTSGPGTSGPGTGAVRIDGDVYRVRVTCSAATPGTGAGAGAGCPATVRTRGSNRSSWIALRATSARRPPPVFLYRAAPGTAWTSLPTDRAGNDIYATAFRGAGDYALTFLADASPGARSTASDSSGGRRTTVIVLIIVFAALAATVGAIRFARTRG